MEFYRLSVRTFLRLLLLTAPLMYDRRSQIDFGLRCMFPKWKDWDIAYTAQGLRRRRLRQSLWYVLLAVALLGAYQVRVSDGGLKSLAANAVQPIRFGILKVIGILHLGLARLESKISVN